MAASFTDFWQPILRTRKFVVLDGALATELERRGADLADPLWSAKLLLENPDLIRQVHLDYLRAGANVITTASYQASFAGFARRGLSQDQAAELMLLSVRLAREARDRVLHERRTGFLARPSAALGDSYSDSIRLDGLGSPSHDILIAASIGCYGAVLHDGSEYRGAYGLSRKDLMDWHRPRLALLAKSGADLLACETIPCRVEAEALLELLAEFPDVPAWLSFSCVDEAHVCHGETLAECVALTRGHANIVAVGINCTPPHLVESLLRSVVGGTDCPLLVYPNSGERWNAENGKWECCETSKVEWGRMAEMWFRAGARLIGGCCRTTPDDIEDLARLVSE